jgi:hypothetical protein
MRTPRTITRSKMAGKVTEYHIEGAEAPEAQREQQPQREQHPQREQQPQREQHPLHQQRDIVENSEPSKQQRNTGS